MPASHLRTVLRLLLPCASHGCRPHWLAKWDVLGARLSFAGLGGWGGPCGFQSPSVLSEKLRVVSSFPIVGGSAGGGVFGKVVSQPPLPISPLPNVYESFC